MYVRSPALSSHYAEFVGFFAFSFALAQSACPWPVACGDAVAVLVGMCGGFAGIACLAGGCDGACAAGCGIGGGLVAGGLDQQRHGLAAVL